LHHAGDQFTAVVAELLQFDEREGAHAAQQSGDAVQAAGGAEKFEVYVGASEATGGSIGASEATGGSIGASEATGGSIGAIN
jgi:hypothetical protein